jgi:transitional endoplasmic reticulum ATPase
MEKAVKLKVAEAIQDDVNKGIVRIDSTFMHELDVRPEDVVEIKGERTTLGIIDRAYPGDIGLNIIRMDGLVRRNARAGISEFVEISKADVKEAKSVVISPIHKDVRIEASPKLFKRGLIGRAVLAGDIVSLAGSRRRKNMHNSAVPFFDSIWSF